MQLRVTDGTTTVDLSGGTTGIRGATYFPQPGAGQESLSETVEVIGAGTAAQICATANSLERLMQAASRRRESQLGTRIWLEYKPVDSDSLHRSELYGGRVVWSEEPGARQLGWPNPVVKYALIIERAPWWEGPETELSISANGQGAATGGRTLTNNGTANWVQVDGAQVAGSLPAPVRLELTYTGAANALLWRFFWGVNAYTPTTFGHVLQGEAQRPGYGTNKASSEASGGQYNEVSVTTTGAWRNAWLLTTSMTAAGGRWFRLLLRLLPGGPTSLRLRAGLFDVSGLNQLWLGPEVTYTGGELVDLGTLPAPPGSWGSGYGEVMLKVWSEAAAGTYNLNLDYAALLPTDAWRSGETAGMSWPPTSKLVVDEIEGAVYGAESGMRYPYLTVAGPGLQLLPGVTQRLVQVEAPGSGAGAVGHTFSVRLYCRPRRATV